MTGTGSAGTGEAGTGFSQEDLIEALAGVGGFFGSPIIDTARAIMAVCTPATGARATGGKATLFATAGLTVPLRRNHALIPVVDGAARPDLLLKTGEAPGGEESPWEITDAGTEVDVLSNIGGVRHNLPAGTRLVLDPPVPGIVLNDPPTLTTALVGGLDPIGWASVRDMALYESFDGPSLALDIRRSMLKRFPAVLVAWQNVEPADGVTTAQTVREARAGTRRAMYKLTYTLSIISSRSDQDNFRRHEGLAVLDLLLRLLADRQAVDGYCFSNPSGVQIREAFRENGSQEIYQKFYVYTVTLSTEFALEQIDLRKYGPWLTTLLNALKAPQEPELPNQGDLPLVVDNLIEMG